MKRFVIHPGPVVSKTDGQLHHVTASELMRLYHVPASECVIARASFPGGRDLRRYPKNLIHLRPRYVN